MNQIMFKSLSCEELNDINGGGIGKDVLQLVKFIVKKHLYVRQLSDPKSYGNRNKKHLNELSVVFDEIWR